MKKIFAIMLAWVILVTSLTVSLGYSKPTTYKKTDDSIVFEDQALKSPHGYIILKAIALLRHDGYTQEADEAQANILPLLEGVTFNDVWGDADLAGGSVLDYYVPDSPDSNYGYGCVLPGISFAPYKNCTNAFKKHPFYLYENAAEEAQFRYDYALRISRGLWGDDPRDLMSGWVVDTPFGQNDPMDGNWANGVLSINSRKRFGTNQTPASAMLDLLQNNTRSQYIFNPGDPVSQLFVPTQNVFNNAPEWLDNHFGNADDIEAYNGYDGQGQAVYASWTLDAGGHCTHGTDCAAPMVVRLPVTSKAHAFFQIGWALHLLEDVTTPVHTVNGSFETYEVHNDVEKRANQVLENPGFFFNGQFIKDALPALDLDAFKALEQFPPPGCVSDAVDPALLFKPRWYTNTLSSAESEGVAHAYVRNSAELSHRFMPYIGCINTEGDSDWEHVGFFTAYGLDLGIKSAAGLIHQFLQDAGNRYDQPVTPPQGRIVFSRYNNGLNQIYIMNEDGTNPVRLTPSQQSDYDPNVGPEGEKIVFDVPRNGGSFEIWSMNVDGTNRTRLTDNPPSSSTSVEDTTPVLSADSTKVAFHRHTQHFPEGSISDQIYLMNADGTNLHPVTSDEVDETGVTHESEHVNPSFSPNGDIVYESTQDCWHEISYPFYACGKDIYTVSGIRVTKTPDGVHPQNNQTPVFSPDGTRIVFISDRGPTPGIGIFIQALGGNAATNLGTGQNGSFPSFSPDGQKIIFSAFDRAQFINHLYVMDVDGTNRTSLTNNTEDSRASWTAGRLKAFKVDDITHAEGNVGATPFTFTVSRSNGTEKVGSIDYTTVDGTATVAHNDYQAKSGTLTFGVGEWSKQVKVIVNGNNAVEGDKTFRLHLSGASGAMISKADGVATIQNDDHVPVANLLNTETPVNTPVNVTLSATDADSDPLTFAVTFPTAHGTLGSISAPSCANGSCTASVTYTPASGYSGFDGFSYVASDGVNQSDDAAVNIHIYVPPNTPVGNNIAVRTANSSVTFAAVFEAGTTTMTPIDPQSAGSLPNGYTLCSTCPAFDIETTAAYAPPVTVCLAVPANVSAPVYASLKLLHGESGSLVDRTTGRYADGNNQRWTCGNVSSLSPFVLAQGSSPTASDTTVTGRIVDGLGKGIEGTVVRLSGSQDRRTITDAAGNYRFDNVTANGFYTLTPSRTNFIFSPVARSFSQLGSTTEAAFTAFSHEVDGNPLDVPEFFVRQQYVDILGREPDEVGFNYWSDQIEQCGANEDCVNAHRRDVAAAFFIEQEFQHTGSYVFRLYRAAFGNHQPWPNPDPNNPVAAGELPRYSVFTKDRARVTGGVNLAVSQQNLANEFVQRPEFLTKYPAGLGGAEFVAALLSDIKHDLGVDLSSQREGLLALNKLGGRGAVLYRLCEDAPQTNPILNRALIDEEYNRSFVFTQYAGYLRRDADVRGLLFWLGQIDGAPLRDESRQRAIVCAFTTSTEYQERFSPVISRSNAECR